MVFRGNGENQNYWYRPSIIDSFQSRVQPDFSYDDNEIVKKPVGSWRDLVDMALRCQNVDLMARDKSMPDPPADSGWVSCKPHRTAHLAHAAILIRNHSPSPRRLRQIVTVYRSESRTHHAPTPGPARKTKPKHQCCHWQSRRHNVDCSFH